jgi:hypothetical protein
MRVILGELANGKVGGIIGIGGTNCKKRVDAVKVSVIGKNGKITQRIGFCGEKERG